MSARKRQSDRREQLARRDLVTGCEPLERRTLLSLSVAGAEFGVNTQRNIP